MYLLSVDVHTHMHEFYVSYMDTGARERQRTLDPLQLEL